MYLPIDCPVQHSVNRNKIGHFNLILNPSNSLSYVFPAVW